MFVNARLPDQVQGDKTRSHAPSFSYDVIQSHSTAFLRGRRLLCTSMHPEEYPPRRTTVCLY